MQAGMQAGRQEGRQEGRQAGMQAGRQAGRHHISMSGIARQRSALMQMSFVNGQLAASTTGAADPPQQRAIDSLVSPHTK